MAENGKNKRKIKMNPNELLQNKGILKKIAEVGGGNIIQSNIIS